MVAALELEVTGVLSSIVCLKVTSPVNVAPVSFISVPVVLGNVLTTFPL